MSDAHQYPLLFNLDFFFVWKFSLNLGEIRPFTNYIDATSVTVVRQKFVKIFDEEKSRIRKIFFKVHGQVLYARSVINNYREKNFAKIGRYWCATRLFCFSVIFAKKPTNLPTLSKCRVFIIFLRDNVTVNKSLGFRRIDL